MTGPYIDAASACHILDERRAAAVMLVLLADVLQLSGRDDTDTPNANAWAYLAGRGLVLVGKARGRAIVALTPAGRHLVVALRAMGVGVST